MRSKPGCVNVPCIGSVSTLLHRARIVNRFLDFIVQDGLIASNPVADLRAEYCVKSSKAILRALLAPESRSGTRSATTVPALRQRPWRSDAQPYRTDAHQRIPIRDASPLVLALRSLSAGSSGACRRAGVGHVAALVSGAFRPPITPPNAKSWLAPWPRLRHHIDPEHQAETPGSASGAAGRATMASALHLQPGRSPVASLISPGPIHLHAHHCAQSASIPCWCWPIARDCASENLPD